jgi:hypothetical protein
MTGHQMGLLSPTISGLDSRHQLCWPRRQGRWRTRSPEKPVRAPSATIYIPPRTRSRHTYPSAHGTFVAGPPHSPIFLSRHCHCHSAAGAHRLASPFPRVVRRASRSRPRVAVGPACPGAPLLPKHTHAHQCAGVGQNCCAHTCNAPAHHRGPPSTVS